MDVDDYIKGKYLAERASFSHLILAELKVLHFRNVL